MAISKWLAGNPEQNIDTLAAKRKGPKTSLRFAINRQ
jgi:hypothetical protein